MASNRLSKALDYLKFIPSSMRTAILSTTLGNIVPMVGTCGAEYLEITPNKVVVRIKNKRAVRNHIRGVHACAMVLAAETATGFAVGVNLPDDKLPLIKSMQIEFKKRASGDITATATLTDEQIAKIKTEPRGEVEVAVVMTDSEDKEPLECKMLWAWVNKDK